MKEVENQLLHLLAEARSINPRISAVAIHARHYYHIEGSTPYLLWEGHGAANACVVDAKSFEELVERLSEQLSTDKGRAAVLRQQAHDLLTLAEQLEGVKA